MLQLYSIFDVKGVVYERPFFAKHVAEATRAVQVAFEQPRDMQPWFCRYPGDYRLCLVGTFDPQTGQIFPTAQGGPEYVIEVASLAPQIGGAS